jgi:hypothetical protein
MTNVQPTSASDSRLRRAYVALAWLAVGNLACAIAFTALTHIAWEVPSSPSVVVRALVFNVLLFPIIGGQVWSWAIIAALVPKRRFVGLLWIVAFATLAGVIEWEGLTMRDPESIWRRLSMIWAGLLSLSVFAIAQGLRFLLGLRLALEHDQPPEKRGQFGTADLLEWTLSIGAFFGMGSLMGWFHNLALLASTIAMLTVVSLPLALAIASYSRHRWPWIAAAVCVAIAASAVHNLVTWRLLQPQMFDLPGWMVISYLARVPAGYLLATAINFAVLRKIGFRLTTSGRC